MEETLLGIDLPDEEATVRYELLTDRLQTVDPVRQREVRYQEVRVVGEGGMAEVRHVRDMALDRDVAKKVLRAEPEVAVQQFWHEARVTALLEHPSIMPVYDAGVDADGQPFFTMKLVDGVDLQRLVREDPPPLRRRVELFVRACEAIEYAHAKGWVHRDLKPQNLLVGAFGEILVADWGLAWSPEGEEEPVWGGTPSYMPPEQCRHEDQGVHCDVFALGGTLWFLCTGKRPSTGTRTGNQRLLQLHRGVCFVPPKRVIPDELHAIVARALQPDPSNRYPSVAALRADLEAWLHHEPVSAYRYPLRARVLRWLERRRSGLVLTGLALLLVAATFTVAGGVAALGMWRSARAAWAAEEVAEDAAERAEQAEADTRGALVRSLVANASARAAASGWDEAAAAVREADAAGGGPLVDFAAVHVFGRAVHPLHRLRMDAPVEGAELIGDALFVLTSDGWRRFVLPSAQPVGQGTLPGRPLLSLGSGRVLAAVPGSLIVVDLQGLELARSAGPADPQEITGAWPLGATLVVQGFSLDGARTWGLDRSTFVPVPLSLDGFVNDVWGDWVAVSEGTVLGRAEEGRLVHPGRSRSIPLDDQRVGSHGGVLVTSTDGGLCGRSLEGPEEPLWCVPSRGLWSSVDGPDGTFFALSEGGDLSWRSLQDGSLLASFAGAPRRAGVLVANEHWVVAGGEEELAVWPLPGGAYQRVDLGVVHRLRAHPGGRLVAVAADDAVWVVDATSGRRLVRVDLVAHDLAWDDVGTGLWATEAGRLLHVDLVGGSVRDAGPGEVVVSRPGGVVVQDGERVRWVDDDGTVAAEQSLPRMAYWDGVRDEDGSVVLAAHYRTEPLLGVRLREGEPPEPIEGASIRHRGFGVEVLDDGREAFAQQDGSVVLVDPTGARETLRWQDEPLLDVAAIPGGFAAVDAAGRLHLVAGDTYTMPFSGGLEAVVVQGQRVLVGGSNGLWSLPLQARPPERVAQRLLRAHAYGLAASYPHAEWTEEERVTIALGVGRGVRDALGERDDPVARLLLAWEGAATGGGPVRHEGPGGLQGRSAGHTPPDAPRSHP